MHSNTGICMEKTRASNLIVECCTNLIHSTFAEWMANTQHCNMDRTKTTTAGMWRACTFYWLMLLQHGDWYHMNTAAMFVYNTCNNLNTHWITVYINCYLYNWRYHCMDLELDNYNCNNENVMLQKQLVMNDLIYVWSWHVVFPCKLSETHERSRVDSKVYSEVISSVKSEVNG